MKSGKPKAESRSPWRVRSAECPEVMTRRGGDAETRGKSRKSRCLLFSPSPLPDADFRLLTSDFRFPLSAFRFPLSAFRFGPALVLLCVICVDEGAAATIRLRDSAEVGSSIITLGDVAEVTDRDANRAVRLQQITLAPAPGTERPLRLDFATIRSRLLAQGVNLADIEFSGRSVVTVTSSAEKKAAAPQLLSRAVSGHVKQAEELITRAVQHVVTVKYTVPAGHVLRQDDLELHQVESTAGALTRPEDVIGKQTSRPIRPGQQIRSPDVRAIPLVRTGDVVMVYSRRPGITVKRKMKARDEGARGETITLVSLDGRKKLLATVIGYHEAEVIGSSGPPKNDLRDATGQIRFQSTR